MSDQFLIEKRGLYYRPDARGYTGLKREAGRYSFEEAAERVGPNGPEGPQDGMGMWREDDAPEFSSSCAWDVRLIEKARQETRSESARALKSLQDENDRLRRILDAIETETSDCPTVLSQAQDIIIRAHQLAHYGLMTAEERAEVTNA